MGRRLGAIKTQGKYFALVGMELPQYGDVSVRTTQRKITEALQQIPTTQELRAWRQRLITIEEIRACECKSGGYCRLATASRPGICARLAQLASKVTPFGGATLTE